MEYREFVFKLCQKIQNSLDVDFLELELNPAEVIFLEQSSQSEQQVQLDVFFYSIFVFVSPVEVFVWKRFLYVCQGEQQAKRNNAPQLLMHENTWGKQKGEDLITNQSMSQLLEGRGSYYWTTPSFTGKM